MAPTAIEASMIAEIIAGVNKKVKREIGDDSDVDDEPDLVSNRGNKLKRKSVYSHEGQMHGKRPYKKQINHAGYDRYILSRKPKRYDREGYQLESDEDDAEADEDAADRDAYHGIDIQSLLMPLTASSELWRHPGMSPAYKNEVLPHMAQQANEMLRREKQTLYLVKELATRFRGDHTFIPCGAFGQKSDDQLFDVEPMLRSIRTQVMGYEGDQTPEAVLEVNVVSAEGTSEAITLTTEHQEADPPNQTQDEGGPDGPPVQTIGVKQEPQPDVSDTQEANGTANGTEEKKADETTEDAMEEDEPVPRMVTRGAAAAANGANGSLDGDKRRSASVTASLPPVHPLFIPPTSTAPDRDVGLPPWEAEDTRKLLNVFIQKQEEVVRGCERLYESLLKAGRLRNTVYRWSRAEGHVGEMSDGEEWVDQEEWGLDEPLRKGAAEGDEETTRDDDRRGKGRRRGAA